MSISSVTNTSALQGINNLSKTHSKLNSIMEKLASGKRINSAKDDAAGLLISDRLSSQLNGLYQANRNANDGIALYQVAEGALDETISSLQRMRTLAIQASNGTLSNSDRQALQAEFDQLAAGIDSTAENTTYNGEQILNGAANGGNNITLHVGPNSGDTVSSALDDGFRMQDLVNVAQNGDSAGNTYGGPFTANVQSNSAVSGPSSQTLSISSQADAESAISAIDSMISYVDSSRAGMGAMQNRLESTINNQSNIAENIADANSRIRDADYAEEVSNMITQSILERATVSMQSQANAKPKMALALLQ
ncbi:flagellin [Succinivibrio sp.]|uniref:flagellin N-terminal helical domain-containing protein n=1 Tax=Succinivibrio sp. TaxID=2053619 RepID=UPI0025F17F84|nr:flagellin [Succinivibrio sp.]MBQ9220203.1 flagellin [Succinivibrio sp.]